MAKKPVKSALGLPIRRGRPVITLTLIGLNVIIFVAGNAVGERGWINQWGLIPGEAGSEPWRLLTSGFVHFDLTHIALNMFALFQFGMVVESLLGRLRFILLYGLSLLGGSGMVVALGTPNSLHAGASGAIFGVLAGFVVLSLVLKRPAIDVMALGGLWLVLGFLVPGLSWQGHLGGAIAGAVSAAIMVRLENPKRRRTGVRRPK